MAKATKLFWFSLTHKQHLPWLTTTSLNTPFLASVALPFPGFLPCPQMLMYCWIPFLTLAPFQVSLTGLTTPLCRRLPNPYLISPEHQTPIVSCLLCISTWMSHWHPAITCCQNCSSLIVPTSTCPSGTQSHPRTVPLKAILHSTTTHALPPSPKTKSYSLLKNLKFRSDHVFPLKIFSGFSISRWSWLTSCCTYSSGPFCTNTACSPCLKTFPCLSKFVSLILFTLWLSTPPVGRECWCPYMHLHSLAVILIGPDTPYYIKWLPHALD